MRVPEEKDEQKAVVEWLRIMGIRHYAITNENQGSFTNRRVAMIQEGKARAMGKVKGIPDLCIFLIDRVLYIEMKRQMKKLKSGKLSNAHSKPTDEQLDAIEWINEYPYSEAIVCYGAKEAIEAVKARL